jgi:hypothetical protein
MAELWVLWIKNNINPRQFRLSALLPIGTGVKHQMNKGVEAMKKERSDFYISGYQSNGTLSQDLRRNCSRFDVFVLREFRFSEFLKHVLRGDIDCDTLPEFKKFMKTFMDESMKKYKEKIDMYVKDEKIGRPSYIPKVVSPRKREKRGARKLSDEERNERSYVKTIIKFFKSGSKTKVFREMGLGQYSVDDVVETFRYYYETGGVQEVKLNEEWLLEHGHIPKDGIAHIIWNKVCSKKGKKSKDAMRNICCYL